MNVTTRVAVGTLCFLMSYPAADAAPKRPVTISKETTHFTSPLTADGFLDYAGAINSRLGKGVSSNDNANVLFWETMGTKARKQMEPEFFRLLGIAPAQMDAASYVDFTEFLKTIDSDQHGVAVAGAKERKRASQRPWKSRECPLIAKWLKVNQRTLKKIVEGVRRPKYFSPLVVPRRGKMPVDRTIAQVVLPAVQQMRACARALAMRALWHMGEGRFGPAWQDLISCHRLGRLVAHGPTLIHVLVGYAIEGTAIQMELTFLRHVDFSAKEIAAYQKDLSLLPRLAETSTVVDLCERCMFLDVTQRIAAAKGDAVGELFGAASNRDAMLSKLSANGIDWNAVMISGNGWYDRIVAAQRHKDRVQRRAALKRIENDHLRLSEDVKNFSREKPAPKSRKVASQMMGAILISLMIPTISGVQRAEEQAEQRFRNLETSLALAAYQSTHGDYPGSLAQLNPKIFRQVAVDIFSGRPLVYRKVSGGCIFFSVGMNGKDEQGRGRDSKPPGDDLEVRLTLPGKKN